MWSLSQNSIELPCSPNPFLECTPIWSLLHFGVHSHVAPNNFWSVLPYHMGNMVLVIFKNALRSAPLYIDQSKWEALESNVEVWIWKSAFAQYLLPSNKTSEYWIFGGRLYSKLNWRRMCCCQFLFGENCVTNASGIIEYTVNFRFTSGGFITKFSTIFPDLSRRVSFWMVEKQR